MATRPFEDDGQTKEHGGTGREHVTLQGELSDYDEDGFDEFDEDDFDDDFDDDFEEELDDEYELDEDDEFGEEDADEEEAVEDFVDDEATGNLELDEI